MSFLFGGGGSKSKTSQNSTTTQQQDPWAPAIPYLTEALGIGKGLYDQHKTLTPEEEAARQEQLGVLKARMSDPMLSKLREAGMSLMGEGAQPKIEKAGSISMPGTASSVLKPPGGYAEDDFGAGVAPAGPRVSMREAMAGMMGKGGVNLRPGDALKSQIASTFGTPPNPASRRKTPDGGGPAGTSPAEPLSPTPTVSPTAARSAQGVLDPTGALAKSMSGQVDNAQLGRMAEASTRAQSRAYRDAIEDSDESLTRSVLPAVRSGAVASGQYGSSRQGIAEGLAIADRNKKLDRAARDLGIATGDASANLHGQAYERAQDRMASTADAVDGRGLSVAVGNADRVESGRRFDGELAEGARRFNTGTALDAKKFDIGTALDVGKTNAGLTLSNNSQEMQRAGMAPGILGAGAQLYGNASNWEDQDFGTMMSVLGLPRSLAFDAYGNYVNPVMGIGGMGGQGRGTQQGTSKTSGMNFNFAVGK